MIMVNKDYHNYILHFLTRRNCTSAMSTVRSANGSVFGSVIGLALGL